MILWAKILIIFWSTFSGLPREDLINRMMWSSFPTGLTEVYWWIHSTFSLQLSASRYRIHVHLDLLHHSRPWDVPFVYNLVFFCTVVSQLCRFLWELTPWTNSYWSNSFHCVSLSISCYFQMCDCPIIFLSIMSVLHTLYNVQCHEVFGSATPLQSCIWSRFHLYPWDWILHRFSLSFHSWKRFGRIRWTSQTG